MGWGSSTRRGGGQKVRALPRKFVFLGFRREESWDVPGILPGCPGPLGVFKKFVQKKFVRIFRSLVRIIYKHSVLTNWGFCEFNFSGKTVFLSLVTRPLSFKNGFSGPLRLGASGVRTFKVRSFRRFARQEIKEMPSVKILPYS